MIIINGLQREQAKIVIRPIATDKYVDRGFGGVRQINNNKSIKR
jgi:hypothetical protein